MSRIQGPSRPIERSKQSLPEEPFSTQMITNGFLVLELATDNNYLKRMTMLFCINELCQAFSKTEIEQLLLPTIIKLSEDSVPNVRFNVAKTLGQIDIEAKVMEEKVSKFNKFLWCLTLCLGEACTEDTERR